MMNKTKTAMNAQILIVEDEKWMLQGIEDLLHMPMSGYEISTLTASNGVEALEILEREKPDLIISDIMMPKMDGLEFLKHVRQNANLKHVPFIFLTARSEPKDRLAGTLSGADLYCVKPFKTDHILQLVKTQLDKTFHRQQAQEEKFSQFKKGLMQILNHEFRTPLTYVLAYTEMLEQVVDTRQADSGFQDYLRGIRAGCVRLTKLVEEFIYLIDLQSGTAVNRYLAERTPISDVPGMLAEVVSEFEQIAQEKSVSLCIKVDDTLSTILAHEEMLRQIFKHLIDNAVKFTYHHQKGGGEVTVKAEMNGASLIVAVQDEGMGIRQSEIEAIFEPFYQHKRDAYEQQGAGMGLSIVKELVNIHQGTIAVESENNQTTFTVCLPLDAPAPTQTKETEIQTVSILAVEDNINLLFGLQELLEISQERYQLEVTTAENGQVALERLAQMSPPPHLIISDIMMPRMNGYEFLDAVRQNPKWAFIPVIFLTAKGEKRDIYQGYVSGVEEYITKPYDGDELLAIVYKQLDRYFSRKSSENELLDDLKQKIIALISPEFQKPLSVVSSYSDVLEEGVSQAETAEDLISSLRGIQEGSNRLSQLVDDFIALAELETGEKQNAYRVSAQPLPTLGFLTYEAAQHCEAEANQVNVSLNYYLPSGLPLVFGVENMLQTVFHIFTLLMIEELQGQKDAQIHIGYSWTDDYVNVSYHGNRPLTQQRIMALAPLIHEELSLKQASHQHPQLIIAKRYLQLHNGRLSLKTEDDGFAFILSLPITVQEA